VCIHRALCLLEVTPLESGCCTVQPTVWAYLEANGSEAICLPQPVLIDKISKPCLWHPVYQSLVLHHPHLSGEHCMHWLDTDTTRDALGSAVCTASTIITAIEVNRRVRTCHNRVGWLYLNLLSMHKAAFVKRHTGILRDSSVHADALTERHERFPCTSTAAVVAAALGQMGPSGIARCSWLFSMALVGIYVGVEAQQVDCTVASSWYWPSFTRSTRHCTGANHLWAHEICWRMETPPDDWNIVCPPGCSWRTKPSVGCVATAGECLQETCSSSGRFASSSWTLQHHTARTSTYRLFKMHCLCLCGFAVCW
jgi:hypothetical protein